MRIVGAAVLASIVLLAMGAGGHAIAEEGVRYSFASIQGGKRIGVPPGGEGRGVIYFYNVDGNRITHVALEVSQPPAGWDVRLEPARRAVGFDLGGRVVEVGENLHVEPSQLLPEETRDVPEGLVCVPIPGRGYALAKPVQVVVRAPQSEKLGAQGQIRISAEASWLGQTGAAAIKQARDFDFSAEVALQPDRYVESVAGARGRPGAGETSEAAPEGDAGYPALVDRWMPTILAVVIVVAGAVLIPHLVARRREGG